MTHSSIRSLLTACALSTLSVSLWAQNLAIVNGKAVPKARAEVLADQLAKSSNLAPFLMSAINALASSSFSTKM